MKKALLEWITELLSPWFMPVIEFDECQMRCWHRVDAIEHSRSAVVEELHELMNHSYERGYKTYERVADDTALELFKMPDIYDVDFPSMRYQFILPRHAWKTTIDTEREHDLIKQDVVRRLTKHFEAHIKEHLFKINPNDPPRRQSGARL